MQKNLLTERQTAEWLGISPKTLQQQRWKRFGIPYIKIGNAVRYDPEDVERHIQENRRASMNAQGV